MKKLLLLIPMMLLVFGFVWSGRDGFVSPAQAEALTIDERVTGTFSAQTASAVSTMRSVTVTAEPVEQVTEMPTATPLATQQAVHYRFLHEWKVAGAPRGYGADILLEDDVTPEELVMFAIKISGDQDPVSIRIWMDEEAYEEMDETSTAYQGGFILVYTRQTISAGALSDVNEVEWMQQVGEFSEFYGQSIQVVN